LRTVRKELTKQVPAFLDWLEFAAERRGLFIWEAFVSGKAKARGHCNDAAVAVRTFAAVPVPKSDILTDDPISLVGVALLRSGWSTDLRLLCTPCIALKATGTVAAIEGA
jgi:hypothetical protein